MCCFIKPWHLLYIEKYKIKKKYEKYEKYENNKFKISAPTWNEYFE